MDHCSPCERNLGKEKIQHHCWFRRVEVRPHFLCSGRVPLSSYTRPCESTSQMRSRASSSERPSSLKKLNNCLATPTPADPAPKKRILCSSRGRSEAAAESFAALMNPDRTTAPVPCYSSRGRAINNSVETGRGEVQTLNVIIECRVFVAIEIQIFESIVCGEVLEKRITRSVERIT